MPVQLKRGAPRLLRTVAGKRHASDDDHENNGLPSGTKAGLQMPTPASSNGTRTPGFVTEPKALEDVDIFADPISSDDERDRGFKLPAQAHTWERKSEEISDFKQPPQLDSFNEPPRSPRSDFRRLARLRDAKEVPTSPKFRKPAVASPPLSTGSKRSADVADHASSDSDGFIFSPQASQAKRPRVASVTQHLHAQSRPAKVKGYGEAAKRKKSREEEEKRKAEPKQAKAAAIEKVKGPTFKLPNLPTDVHTFQGQDADSGFKQLRRSSDAMPDCELGAEDFRPDSPDLSDLSSVPSSPPHDVVATLGLQSVEPRVREMECAICGANAPASLREDYEDQYPQAKQWSYKWQQRFCRYHKQHEASQLWEERGYPGIDWIGLDARLRQRQHMTHLQRIISGETASIFRRQFEAKVKSRSKTLMQIADNNDDAGMTASAGYYGARGEKLMTDHIITSFADHLRDHATKDKLVATSGVSGGVSGFVQSVLVPELAVSLIREDLGPKGCRDPVVVLAESAELGELLWPELADRVSDMDGDGMMRGIVGVGV